MRCYSFMVDFSMETVLMMLIGVSDMIKCVDGAPWSLFIPKVSRSSFVSYPSVVLWGIIARRWRKDTLL